MPIKRGKLKQIQLTLTELFSNELEELSNRLNLNKSETITKQMSQFVKDTRVRREILNYIESQYRVLAKDERTTVMTTYNILESDHTEIERIGRENQVSKSMLIRGTISYFLNVVYNKNKKKIDTLIEKIKEEGHKVTGEFLQTDNSSVYIKFRIK